MNSATSIEEHLPLNIVPDFVLYLSAAHCMLWVALKFVRISNPRRMNGALTTIDEEKFANLWKSLPTWITKTKSEYWTTLAMESLSFILSYIQAHITHHCESRWSFILMLSLSLKQDQIVSMWILNVNLCCVSWDVALRWELFMNLPKIFQIYWEFIHMQVEVSIELINLKFVTYVELHWIQNEFCCSFVSNVWSGLVTLNIL